MENKAMRFCNFVANKFFGLAFSWALGQPIKDTLCGTKVLFRQDYERIAANRAHFGDFDPFGDFDLLFGASRIHLKIADVPIRYRDRTYGTDQYPALESWLALAAHAFACDHEDQVDLVRRLTEPPSGFPNCLCRCDRRDGSARSGCTSSSAHMPARCGATRSPVSKSRPCARFPRCGRTSPSNLFRRSLS